MLNSYSEEVLVHTVLDMIKTFFMKLSLLMIIIEEQSSIAIINFQFESKGNSKTESNIPPIIFKL